MEATMLCLTRSGRESSLISSGDEASSCLWLSDMALFWRLWWSRYSGGGGVAGTILVLWTRPGLPPGALLLAVSSPGSLPSPEYWSTRPSALIKSLVGWPGTSESNSSWKIAGAPYLNLEIELLNWIKWSLQSVSNIAIRKKNKRNKKQANLGKKNSVA